MDATWTSLCVCEVERLKSISDKKGLQRQWYQVVKVTQAVCEGMTGRGEVYVCVSMLVCVERERERGLI